ncbi:flagellar basal body P-ring formation chaperone FlgA [Brucella pseudogrignonensis]|uniref:flagellar basal body P-ring formation chaperone FlgA n=1 Tax=Brucella pseudogrignonensis TaxID=419475 RepID=UPI0028B8C120|nr:flagellar basal body P-ring formation chaperone FlgA [Brucella pseudogrignonensis]MDT6941246.1 flagellar basal body P-ring formation chaperone FlgA [Brucella pseudogrignonensis]
MIYAKAYSRKLRLAFAAGLFLSACWGANAAEHMAFFVPSATVYPGQVVSDVSLVEKKFYISRPAATQYVLSPDQVTGKVARKTLLSGKPILMAALSEPSLVTRGVPASMVFTSGPLTITATGMPLESGAVGDFIKIRNMDSGIIVSGTVLADGRIQVGMQ